MATTPLAESYRISGSGFDQKIRSLVGIGQSIKQSQVAKQKFQQQLDLIDARAEATFERQKKYAEEVVAPRQQRQQVAQAQQQRAEQIQQSLEDTQQTIQEYQDRRLQDNFQNVSRYNLDDFHFTFDTQTDEGGNLQGYQPAILYGHGENARSIGHGEYTDLLAKRRNFADWLDTLQETDVADRPPEQGTTYISPQQKEQYIKSIKTDPSFRQQQFNLFDRGEIDFQPVESDGSADGKATPQTISTLELGLMKEEFEDYPTKEYTWSEDVSSMFGGEVGGKFTVDYTNSVSGVKEQINTAFRKGLLPDDNNFTLDRLSRDQLQAVARGQMPDGVPEDLQSDLTTLLSYERESTKNTVQELLNNYLRWDSMYGEYSKTARQALPPDQIFLDIWGAPTDLENLNDYKQIFKPISETTHRDKLVKFDETIRRQADLLGDWWGGYGDITE